MVESGRDACAAGRAREMRLTVRIGAARRHGEDLIDHARHIRSQQPPVGFQIATEADEIHVGFQITAIDSNHPILHGMIESCGENVIVGLQT